MKPAGRRQAILAVILLVCLSFTIATELDKNLAPFLTHAEYERVTAAADYLAARGWTEPILVAWGPPGLYTWSLLRSYLGDRVGQTYVYYGKLQNLYYGIPPYNKTYYRSVPDVELVSASQNFAELSRGIGADPAAIRTHPVVVLVPDSYNYPLSEAFAYRYQIGKGVFVIPPGAVTLQQLSTWNLSAATDFAWINAGSAVAANWSLSPWMLFDSEANANHTFVALYPFSTALEANYTFRVHLMDEPSAFPPISFLVDGVAVLSHYYTGQGPVWISGTVGNLSAGPHTVEVVSGSEGVPLRVALDVMELALA